MLELAPNREKLVQRHARERGRKEKKSIQEEAKSVGERTQQSDGSLSLVLEGP